jgi:hypothetical protein
LRARKPSTRWVTRCVKGRTRAPPRYPQGLTALATRSVCQYESTAFNVREQTATAGDSLRRRPAGTCRPPPKRGLAWVGGAELMLPRAACGAWVRARSPSDTMLTGWPPSTTSRRQIAFSRMSRTASSPWRQRGEVPAADISQRAAGDMVPVSGVADNEVPVRHHLTDGAVLDDDDVADVGVPHRTGGLDY